MKTGALITLVAASMAGAGCREVSSWEAISGRGLKGSGKPVSRTFEIKDVKALKAGGSFVITVTPDSAPLIVTCDDNLMPHLVQKVDAGVLSLGFDRSISSNLKLTASVGVKSLESLDLSGACSLQAEGVDLESLTADISGAARAQISGKVSKAAVKLTGSSSFVLNADPEEITFDVSGASKFESKGTGEVKRLKGDVSGASFAAVSETVSEADLKLSGASSAEIEAKKLTGSASGASSLKLRSKPLEESFDVSGASSRTTLD